MNTTLRDFVTAYQRRHSLRLHMPGHKGRGPLGVEKWDITETPPVCLARAVQCIPPRGPRCAYGP